MPNQNITIPPSYVTEASSEILITNHPMSSAQVTPIQIVTLNRPKKLNAISGTMIETLITLFRTVHLDDRVKVVILTGAGDKAFSAGIDLSMDTSQRKNTVPPKLMRDPGGTLALAMLDCSKPILVAYNGLLCRHRHDLDPRGHDSGIFAEIVPKSKDVLPRAVELAADMLANVSLMAVHLNRQLIWRNPGSAEHAHLVDSPLLYDMFGGEDHLEFKNAFFGKRAPSFQAQVATDAPRSYPWWDAVSVEVPATAGKPAQSKI